MSKLSHHGIARVARYAEKAADGGESREEALTRGRRLELDGRLTPEGEVKPIHPDEKNAINA